MQSVISCFNPTLFRKNFSRFWPIWGLYGVVWLFLLPLHILSEARWWTQEDAHRLPLSMLDNGGVGLFSAVVFGILAAMAVFSYLYSSRSVGMIHALPMRREGLFLTNYLSGLGFLLLPNLVIFLLSLAAEVMAGAVDGGSLIVWFIFQCLLCFFFFSFAAFCAMLTGNILALPAFYIIFNGLFYTLVTLLSVMAHSFLYGFYSAGTLLEWVSWFTPVLRLYGGVRLDYPDGAAATCRLMGLHIVLLYAFVGLVLAALALAAYRRRQLERAGDVVSISWLRPVFKYSVGFCAAVSLGMLLYEIFLYSLPQSAWTLLIFMLLGGAVGYFVAEMLLHKSFWVFRKGWKGCVALLVCLVCAMSVMELDLLGFERRIPDTDATENVLVSSVSSAPYDDAEHSQLLLETPEEIDLARQLHQAIIDDKERAESEDQVGWLSHIEADGLEVQTQGGTSIRLNYNLLSGDNLIRSYWVDVTQDDLQNPDSPAALLTRLINLPAVVERTYFSNWQEDHRLINAVIYNVPVESTDAQSRYLLSEQEESPADSGITSSAEVTYSGNAYTDMVLDNDALEPLLQAIFDDIRAGNLGRRYLLEDRDRMENCCYADLTLTFYAPNGIGGNANATNYNVTITLQKSAVNTLAVLEAYGVDVEHQLPTQAQVYIGSHQE
jgi:ABC-2 type transport system permease protein